MRYTIAPAGFERYPLFRRAVLVARGVDNSREVPAVLALLRTAEAGVECHIMGPGHNGFALP